MTAHYRRICILLFLLLTSQSISSSLPAQALGEPDRGLPGDPAIQDYLAKRAVKQDALFLPDATSSLSTDQEQKLREQFFDMLGLEVDAPHTPLNSQVTGEIDGGDYVIEKVHFQSRPQLYVTGNLYRPKNAPTNGKLPAVLFVCGHSGMGRNGNKTAFQSHGIWLAKHG